jgi:RNA polymerase sigma-70 factor (ECF subfamily)
MNAARDESLAIGYEAARTELTTYATRLLANEHAAEEVVQQAALRMLQSESVPTERCDLRAWLFRVVTNLGLDYLRKHSTWRETMLVDAKALAGSTPDFVANSRALAGSPEMRMVAAEHLVVCFSCTLRNLKPQESAALLMKEVYGFTVEEVAETIGASFAQVKNWIQSGRATLAGRYAETCALVSQRGVCHQCVELDGFFRADKGDPLAGTARDIDARLELLRQRRDTPLSPWHKQMMQLVKQIIEGS